MSTLKEHFALFRQYEEKYGQSAWIGHGMDVLAYSFANAHWKEIEQLVEREEQTQAALRCAISHIEHMAAWIGKQNSGYSFESLGEDMPGIEAACHA